MHKSQNIENFLLHLILILMHSMILVNKIIFTVAKEIIFLRKVKTVKILFTVTFYISYIYESLYFRVRLGCTTPPCGAPVHKLLKPLDLLLFKMDGLD